jgi:energy-coupling factor transporter ATP-binding protein EcfA2
VEGQANNWTNQEGSPVWCNPLARHSATCTGSKPELPQPAQPQPAQPQPQWEPLPPPQGGGQDNNETPQQEQQQEQQPEGQENKKEDKKDKKEEEESSEPPDEPSEDDPLKPLVDIITKKVLKIVDPRVNAASEIAKKALAAAKEGGTSIKLHKITWTPPPPAPQQDMGIQHACLPTLLFWIQMGEPVYLAGPPGSGKSEASRTVARMLGREFGALSLNPGTPESRLIGYMDATRNYHSTTYRKLYEHGGVCLIDEMDNASPAILTSINSHTTGIGGFPDGMVERSPNFVLIATGNTVGRGGTLNHSDRRALDAATMDRFTVINWPYDEGLETLMVSGVLEDKLKLAKWLEWVRKIRAFCAERHPRLVVSPRASVKGAKALQHSKLPSRQVVEEVLFKGLEAATVRGILAEIPITF